MKKSIIAATVGVLAGATLLMSAPAMAREVVGFGVSVGVPVVGPAPYYVPAPAYAPAPVVYGGYGPVVQVGAPYYYGHYYHGYRGAYYGGYHGWRR